MKIDLQVDVEHKDGKYPSFDLILRTGEGKDPFMIVRGCRVVSGANGEFISYPSRKNENGKYWNHVWAHSEFNEMILKKAKSARPAAPRQAAKPEDPLQDLMDSDVPF